MIWIYCKTVDAPNDVGDFICKENSFRVNNESKSRVMNDESEDGCWVIKTDCENEIIAMLYRAGSEVVVIEIDDICASTVIDPLMKKYGFENIKWLVTK